MVGVDELINYINDWTDGTQIREHFNLSQGQFHRMMRWLSKAGMIKSVNGYTENGSVDRRKVYYIAIKKK